MDLEDAFDSGNVEFVGPHGAKIKGRVYTEKKDKKEEAIPAADAGSRPRRETSLIGTDTPGQNRYIGSADVAPNATYRPLVPGNVQDEDEETRKRMKLDPYYKIQDKAEHKKFQLKMTAPSSPKERDFVAEWIATLGGDREAQLTRLKSNKSIRRALGIDESWFTGIMRAAARGDEAAQQQLEALIAPVVSKEEQKVVAEKRGDLKKEKEMEAELANKRKELLLSEEFKIADEKRKEKSSMDIASFRAGLKNPDMLRQFDNALGVFDKLMEGADSARQIEEFAQQAFGDNIPPFIFERGKQTLLGDSGTKAKSNAENYEKAIAAIDKIAERLYNDPDAQSKETARLAKLYGVDQEVLYDRLASYQPSEKEKAEREYWGLINEARVRPLSPREEAWMEKYQRSRPDIFSAIRQNQAEEQPKEEAPKAPEVQPTKDEGGTPQYDISVIRENVPEMTPAEEEWLRANREAREALVQRYTGVK